MTTQHHSTTEEFKSRAADIAKARDLNKADPDVPNRTKVVRLIVVPPEISEGGDKTVRDFAMARRATRADVFVVWSKSGWVPMSWLGQGLVDHHTAHHAHPESVLVLMVVDREQVQWESDVPFRIASITRPDKDGQEAKENHHFPSSKVSPKIPFPDALFKEVGYPGRPIVSGPPDINGKVPYNQLYKVSFLMMLPGNRDWTPVDPDIYCDWN